MRPPQKAAKRKRDQNPFVNSHIEKHDDWIDKDQIIKKLHIQKLFSGYFSF